jgi:hypothetical protein
MSIIYCSICGMSFDDEFKILQHYETIHHQQFINTLSPQEVLDAKTKTKSAAIAAIISGIITTILALLEIAGMDRWNLLDAAFTFSLAIGIIKNNRACAVILFIYWIISKLMQVVSSEINFIWLIVAIIFAVYYWKGIVGTFTLQRYSMEVKKQISQVGRKT